MTPFQMPIGSWTWLLSETMIERLGWVLLHTLWQFSLIAALTLSLLRMLKRASASLRYAFLICTMAACVVVPVVMWFSLPTEPTGIASTAQRNAMDLVSMEPTPTPRGARSGTTFDSDGTGVALELPDVSDNLLAENSRSRTESSKWWMVAADNLRPWLMTIVTVWILGVMIFSVRPLLSWIAIRRWRRVGTSPVNDEVSAMMLRLSERLGVRCKVELLQSSFVHVPLVFGYLRPLILLPASLLANLPTSQLEAIIAHELAHVRRYDFLLNFMQIIIETLFFYHPAIWWLSNRVRIERENCCDDLVVSILCNRVEYGKALLAVEESPGAARSLALGARDGSLLARVQRLAGLEAARSGPIASATVIITSVLLIAGTAFMVAGLLFAAGDDNDTQIGKESNGLHKGTASEKIEPWEISKLYEAAFLRKHLMDHEVLPKPIVVPAVRGKVLDPNGKPATGVNFVSYTPRQWINLDAVLTIDPLNSGSVKKTKQGGTFGLPERTEPYRVLLTHESGIANVSHEELLRAHGGITLQKWASVTGTLTLDGKSQAGENIELHFDTLPWSYSRGGPRLTTVHRTTTDKDGNFSFDRVPPLGGIAHARALGGTVYQCESGKNTHIEIGVGRTVTGKLQLPEHIQKSKLQVVARNHLLPIPYPKDWTDQVTQAERDAWRIKWLQTAEGYEYADRNYVLVNTSVPGSIADDGTFTIYGVPEKPMVLVVLLPREAILLEQPFDTSNAPNSDAPSKALNLGTVIVSDTRLQRENLHDHQHEDGNQGGQVVGKPHLPKLIVRTIDSKGTPVPNTGVRFYDRNSQRAGQKQKFEMINKQTDESGVAEFGVMPNSFGCLQLSPSNQEFAQCYTLISATMTKCTQANPPRANVQTEIKDGILTVTFTMTPHVDLEFNIVDDATNEIVYWSEIFYQEPDTNHWWIFGLVDGSQRQHNFIPISPQITRETMRISALGYETKVFRLPDELDRNQPIRRDVRLKPMPDVELKVLLPDGNPAEKAQLKFHYPNGVECLQIFEWKSNLQGIVTTKFPPHADIGSLRLEHPAGAAELSMQELLDEVKQSPGKVIRRNIQLRKSKQQKNAGSDKAVTTGDHATNPASWLPIRPQKTIVSSGSATILDDHSIRLEGDATWQEVTTDFTFDQPTTVDELRLELLPVDTPAGPQLGRKGKQVMLFDVKAGVQEQTGKWTAREFSACTSLMNPDDQTTIDIIDYQSDTGWTVPVLPENAEAHTLVLRFDEPVTLQPSERLVLIVDSGSINELAVLNRIRFAFHQPR